ncbi:hypothetical protein EBZ37_15185, partial [bacterium]|nr:hypothetical protein [bacterium]
MDKSRSEDVRRRNREIIERANAELRSEKRAERKLTRFPLLKMTKDLQQLHCDLSFACTLPPIELGYILPDHSIDHSVFTKFRPSEIFLDAIRSKLLLNEEHILFPDMLNATLAAREPFEAPEISEADQGLLNDLPVDYEPSAKKRKTTDLSTKPEPSIVSPAATSPRPTA